MGIRNENRRPSEPSSAALWLFPFCNSKQEPLPHILDGGLLQVFDVDFPDLVGGISLYISAENVISHCKGLGQWECHCEREWKVGAKEAGWNQSPGARTFRSH